MSKEGRPFTRFTPSRSIPSSIQKESGNSEFAFTGLYTCTSQIRSVSSKAMDPVHAVARRRRTRRCRSTESDARATRNKARLAAALPPTTVSRQHNLVFQPSEPEQRRLLQPSRQTAESLDVVAETSEARRRLRDFV